MNVAGDIWELIGNTPLVRLRKGFRWGCRRRCRQAGVVQPRRQREGSAIVANRCGGERQVDPPDTIIVEPPAATPGSHWPWCVRADKVRADDARDHERMERRMLLRAYGADLIPSPGR